VDLSEAFARIVGRRSKLIVLLVVLGLALGFFVSRGTSDYKATARLVLPGAGPVNSDQAGVISDTARAVATGPNLVQSVLNELNVSRNARVVAAKHVTVRSLGTSGVVALSVTDTNAAVAQKLANGIARATVDAWQQVVDSSSALRTQPTGSVIDSATLPTSRASSSRPVDMIAGGLLGLILGLMIGAALETLRPTLVGRVAIGRRVAAPVLLELDSPPTAWNAADIDSAARHIELASSPARVGNIAVVGVGSADAVTTQEVAAALNAALPGRSVTALDPRSGALTQPREDETSILGWRMDPDNWLTGLVILAPRTVLQDEIDRAHEIASIAGWPVLGVLVFKPTSRAATERPRKLAAASTGSDSAV
jgi:capsular polysaccharide biosynthesis protein